MTIFIIGLVLFLGMHSVMIFAPNWSRAQIEKIGENKWHGIYSIISLIGFLLIIWGYAEASDAVTIVWYPPLWSKYLASVFIFLSFIFLTAAYIPGTKMKSVIGHPMIIGVKLWAFGHLLTNGTLLDIILFGSFLLWAILDFRSSRQKDRAENKVYEFVGYQRDAIAIVLGLVSGLIFVLYLHGPLIGVAPFG